MVFNKGEGILIDWENVIDDGMGRLVDTGGTQCVLIKEDFDMKESINRFIDECGACAGEYFGMEYLRWMTEKFIIEPCTIGNKVYAGSIEFSYNQINEGFSNLTCRGYRIAEEVEEEFSLTPTDLEEAILENEEDSVENEDVDLSDFEEPNDRCDD